MGICSSSQISSTSPTHGPPHLQPPLSSSHHSQSRNASLPPSQRRQAYVVDDSAVLSDAPSGDNTPLHNSSHFSGVRVVTSPKDLLNPCRPAKMNKAHEENEQNQPPQTQHTPSNQAQLQHTQVTTPSPPDVAPHHMYLPNTTTRILVASSSAALPDPSPQSPHRAIATPLYTKLQPSHTNNVINQTIDQDTNTSSDMTVSKPIDVPSVPLVEASPPPAITDNDMSVDKTTNVSTDPLPSSSPVPPSTQSSSIVSPPSTLPATVAPQPYFFNAYPHAYPYQLPISAPIPYDPMHQTSTMPHNTALPAPHHPPPPYLVSGPPPVYPSYADGAPPPSVPLQLPIQFNHTNLQQMEQYLHYQAQVQSQMIAHLQNLVRQQMEEKDRRERGLPPEPSHAVSQPAQPVAFPFPSPTLPHHIAPNIMQPALHTSAEPIIIDATLSVGSLAASVHSPPHPPPPPPALTGLSVLSHGGNHNTTNPMPYYDPSFYMQRANAIPVIHSLSQPIDTSNAAAASSAVISPYNDSNPAYLQYKAQWEAAKQAQKTVPRRSRSIYTPEMSTGDTPTSPGTALAMMVEQSRNCTPHTNNDIPAGTNPLSPLMLSPRSPVDSSVPHTPSAFPPTPFNPSSRIHNRTASSPDATTIVQITRNVRRSLTIQRPKQSHEPSQSCVSTQQPSQLDSAHHIASTVSHTMTKSPVPASTPPSDSFSSPSAPPPARMRPQPIQANTTVVINPSASTSKVDWGQLEEKLKNLASHDDSQHHQPHSSQPSQPSQPIKLTNSLQPIPDFDS